MKRTNLSVDQTKLEKAVELTKAQSPSEAVDHALDEFIKLPALLFLRQYRRQRFIAV